MISLAQPMMGMGMGPMQRRREPIVPPLQERRPSAMSMAGDLAATKAIDMGLEQVGKEGAKKALSAAGATIAGPIGAMAGEVGGELLAPFIKSLLGFKHGGFVGPIGMEAGGKVPPKYKGFAKLPEAVQQKISPKLAKEYEMGGRVSGPPMSAEQMMFGNMGVSPTSLEKDYFKTLMETGKLPLGSGYSVKPDANKKGGSLTLEYEFSKDPSRNFTTGIKGLFNRFSGGR